MAKPPIAGGNRVPYTFDKLSQLLKTERRMPAANSYESDHFGFGMATNRYFVVAYG